MYRDEHGRDAPVEQPDLHGGHRFIGNSAGDRERFAPQDVYGSMIREHGEVCGWRGRCGDRWRYRCLERACYGSRRLGRGGISCRPGRCCVCLRLVCDAAGRYHQECGKKQEDTVAVYGDYRVHQSRPVSETGTGKCWSGMLYSFWADPLPIARRPPVRLMGFPPAWIPDIVNTDETGCWSKTHPHFAFP